jgi:hypothetical protein
MLYYLANAVVPRPFLSRASALFGAIGSITGSLYGWYIYQYSEEYMKAILVVVEIVYVVGFTSQCVFVKEGQYPGRSLLRNAERHWSAVEFQQPPLTTLLSPFLGPCGSFQSFF